jgi:hypothetical protein
MSTIAPMLKKSLLTMAILQTKTFLHHNMSYVVKYFIGNDIMVLKLSRAALRLGDTFVVNVEGSFCPYFVMNFVRIVKWHNKYDPVCNMIFY